MRNEFRRINSQNLQDAIQLMNESSRGTSLECHLDFFSFLTLSRYWDFCYEHSFVLYADGEPAALMIACTEPQVHEAYIYYWGALPRFRNRRSSLALAEFCAQSLCAAGYIKLYADSASERPVRRYRFVHCYPQYNLIEMRAESFLIPAPDPRYKIRQIDVDDVWQIPLLPEEHRHWSQRQSFLGRAASFLKFIGAFNGDALNAIAVIFPGHSGSTLVDIRSTADRSAAGHELLRWFLEHCPPPFVAPFVSQHSYRRRLLEGAGFRVARSFSSLIRDLPATCSIQTRA